MTPLEQDPLGHGILADRLGSIAGQWKAMITNRAGFTARSPKPGESFIVTGIGSSEAHARFLAWLLNRRRGAAAEFVPLVAFDNGGVELGAGSRDRTLVLFSQGLSRNVRLVLEQRHRFARMVLFTAATGDGLMRDGRPDRAEWLRQLETEGAEIIRFPLENEYEILIRVVGPACGFLAARLWADSLDDDSAGAISPGPMVESIAGMEEGALTRFLVENSAACAGGFRILAPPALAQFGQNLVCKCVEGVFWSPPVLVDYLSFAHGPFQQLAARPAPVVLLRGGHPGEGLLADRALEMCRTLKLPVVVVPLTAPAGWEVLEAEVRFNQALLALVRNLRIDQRNWPGRGADGPLYAYP